MLTAIAITHLGYYSDNLDTSFAFSYFVLLFSFIPSTAFLLFSGQKVMMGAGYHWRHLRLLSLGARLVEVP